MIRSGRTAALLLLIAWAAPRPASAQPGPAGEAPGVVAAIPGSAPARAVLVGPSGELYLPSDAPDTPEDTGVTWRRHAAGGVAVDVQAAMSPKPGEYIVAGAHTPLYRSIDDIWRVLPLSQRGPVLLSATGGAIALAVGPHLHVFKAGTFQRVARARARPVALWASSSDRLYVARQGGGLDKWHNRRWSAIRLPLAEGDEILALAGHPGRALYALAQSGAVLDVGASKADELRRPPELEALTAHAMTVAADGTLWLAGMAAPADPAAPTGTLVLASRAAKAESIALVSSSAPPELAAGDRVTVLIAGTDGALLVATRAGRVLLRDPSGRWRKGRIETAPPPAKSTPATAAPARTR